MARSLLLFVHVLLFVTWLGIDVGVFTSSFLIRRRGLSGDARVELRRLMRGLDLAPRLSVVLTVPVALALADVSGVAEIPTPVVVATSLVAAAWLAAMIWSYQRVTVLGVARRDDAHLAGAFVRVDLALRVLVTVGFGGAGLGSLLGVLDTFTSPVVAWKALLFATTIVAGLTIRRAARPFTPALRQVVEHGEDPTSMATMDRAMRRVYPAVLYIWGSLVVMAALAFLRPHLGG